MRALLLIPLLLVVGASLFVGYLGCVLGTCFLTLPILALVAFVAAFFTVIIIFRNKYHSKLTKGFSLLLIPAYILGATFVANISMEVFLQLQNKSYEEQQLKRGENNQKGIPEIGTISQVGPNFVYECKECGFKLEFPSSWQYRTDIGSSNRSNPYLTIRLLPDTSVKIPDYPGIMNKDITDKEINVISYPANIINHAAEAGKDELYQKEMGYQIEMSKINGTDFRISKKLGEARKISDNYHSIYAFAQEKNRKIIVQTFTGIPFDTLNPTTYDAFTRTLSNLRLF